MPQPIKKASAVKDSVDVAKLKSGSFAKKDFSRKDFAKKTSPLTDSSTKYSGIVFNAAKSMGKEDLAKKGISKTITPKGDTIYKYKSSGVSFDRVSSPVEKSKPVSVKNKNK
jgi:hypothetical protein